jgi:hypothetical protein
MVPASSFGSTCFLVSLSLSLDGFYDIGAWLRDLGKLKTSMDIEALL